MTVSASPRNGASFRETRDPVGRLPPHDLDAEAAVLAAAMRDGDEVADRALAVLRPADFYSEAHGLIWRAISELRREGAELDLVAVGSRLRAHETVMQVGGLGYLARIVGNAPAIGRVETHAAVVADRAQLRRAAAAYQRAAAAVYDARDFPTWKAATDETLAAIERTSTAPPILPQTPAAIVAGWASAGPVVRVPCGVEPLDALCYGGLPVPRRVVIVGAPSAGKTAMAAVIADRVEREGLCVGVLAVDEEPEDWTARLAQLSGYRLDDIEERDPEVLVHLTGELEARHFRVYGPSWTIESAAADLTAWAAAEQRLACFVVDSLQTVRAEAALEAETPRLIAEANIAALRTCCADMLVVATSEANRASYRTQDAGEVTADIASGAESRGIEFGAQTLLMLRTPKDHADVVHARVAKNRRLDRGEFWLRLDRQRHELTTCAEPGDHPEELAERDAHKRRAARRGLEGLANLVLDVVAQDPGMGSRALRAAVRATGERAGVTRLDAAIAVAASGVDGRVLVDRRAPDAPSRTPNRYHVEHVEVTS